MKRLGIILNIFVVMTLVACGQNVKNTAETPTSSSLTVKTVFSHDGILWGMDFLPNGALLVTDKSGKLLHHHNNTTTTITGMPEVYDRGQGGLLDVKVHPNYRENSWIYITYASPEGSEKGGHTALMRAKIKDNALVNKEVLYKAGPNTTKGQHFGSRIVLDGNGYVYFSIGERGERDVNPQDITRDGGKIYRLYEDGRIPEDNPFVHTPNAKPAIYTYGNRNPQGLLMHPETKELWEHEHGPKGGDEINIIKKGANYGWPLVTYGVNYSGTTITETTEKEGVEGPIHYWTPSIAPSGMAFVTSDKYPNWKGNLLVGSLSFQYLERVVLDGKKVVKQEKLLIDAGRVRNVIQGPDGYIYAAVEGTGIVQLVAGN